MKKITCQYILLVFIYLFSIHLDAQEQSLENESIEKITKALDSYFLLDRENIHLHLNKNVFLTDESIWFKGYILDRKQNVPYVHTTNIFIVLLDQNGKRIEEKLIFASNGTFFGNIKLNKEMPSGNYFIQAYTNWMNNFTEDESYFQKITIVNSNNPSLLNQNINFYNDPNINFYPEGGSFLYGINNTMGIKVLDCNNKPFPIKEGDLIDSKGQFIKKIYLNKFGDGKFDLIASNEVYKVVFHINNNIIEKQLPIASLNGVTLEINNYNINNKVVAKVKTNKNSINSYIKNPPLLLIHQDDKATFFEINFKNETQELEFIFSDENLYDGVNTIRIIDHEFNEIAQRLIFKYPKNLLKNDITIESKNNPIKFCGKLNFPSANISISVLPENSIATNEMPDIHGSLLVKPYITDLNINTRYYLSEITRTKRYEMDLFLLNQITGKYKWNNILNNPPKKNYEFDYGLSIAGRITQEMNDPKKHKIRLKSFRYQILEVKDLDEKNEFLFKNIVLPDSAKIDFTLLKMPKLESIKFKYFANILNGKRVFNKVFKPYAFSCHQNTQAENHYITYEVPKIYEEIIYLKDVEITQSNKLKRQNYFENNNLRGYKVPENSPMDVLSYIEQNGFKVSRETGSVMITERGVGSINAAPATPVIFIDNIRIISYEQLWGMRMDELDEIYINSTILVPSITNNRGIIRMYRKALAYKAPETDSKTYFIKNGFAKNENFKNITYKSYTDKGFENFGIINWLPNIITENTNEFKFEIPEMHQRKIKMIVEGFTSDGKIISEEKIIEMP